MAIDPLGDAEAHAPVDAPFSARLRALASRVGDSFSTSDDAVLAAEPASPHHLDVAEPTSSSPESVRSVASVGLAVLLGLAGSVVVVATSPLYHLAPPVEWRFTFPGLQPGFGATSLYFGATFLFGVLAMAAGWLLLIGRVIRSNRSQRSRVKLVVGVVALWAVPFLIGPIQISTDAYSYSAQGYMATLGMDPSAVGPEALPIHSSPFYKAADVIWRKSPAPYGPVAVAGNKAAVILSGDDVTWSVFLIRLTAVAGVVMAGIGIYQIAARRKANAALALVIAVGNPVVLLHFIGGGHNDALMTGLLCLGLASWEKSRKWLAVVLIALAVCVKLPAVIALAYIAWNWHGGQVDWKQRLSRFPIVGAAVATIAGALCVAVGIGFGWVTALSSTGSVYSTFSPSTKLGFILSDLVGGVGINVDALTVVAVTRALGLFLAGAVMVAVLLRSDRIGVTKSTGIALLTLMLCSPVIWPWYLPVGFALLAAAGIRRYRPSIVVLIVASSLLVWPTSVNAVVPLSRYQHWLGLLVVLTIAGSCLAAQYVARVAERRRSDGGVIPTIEAVLIGPVGATADAAPRTTTATNATAVPVDSDPAR